MPALAKKKSGSLGETPALATATKRKKASKDVAEATPVSKDPVEHKAKKLKGKEKAQDEDSPVVEVTKTSKKPVTKKQVETKEKERRVEEKTARAKAGFKNEKQNKETKGKADGKKKSKKAPTPSPEPSDAESDVEEKAEGADQSGDEGDNKGEAQTGSDKDEVLLHGFSSESDSSDDEDDDVDKAPLDVGKLPTIAKDDETVKRKLEKAKRQPTEDRGVLYLGRIPHGFYEDQMKAYFSQFGEVTRLRLSRNKKTGGSKHYAFIEYKSSAVAQIVAGTMDNYLLTGHLLRCKVIPKEEVHPELWVSANKKFKKVPTDRIERQKHNKTRTDEEKRKVESRLLRRQEQKKRKLQALGIDYDFGQASYSKKAKQDI